MGFFKGIRYNFRGLSLGLRTPRLLLLGMVRFGAVVIITVVAAGFILTYHTEILDHIWKKPEIPWIIWLWHMISWLLSLVLMGLSAVVSFLISQILFSVVLMDLMSRITEKMISGTVKEPVKISLFRHFFYLVKQEIPRASVPVFLILLLTVLSWLTPLGPIITIVLSGIAAVFLAWDSTDLTPARRMVSFRSRFSFLVKALPFHLGFGIVFLIPLLNILFLSFSPIGATLYYIESQDQP
jgi:CysZ protein